MIFQVPSGETPGHIAHSSPGLQVEVFLRRKKFNVSVLCRSVLICLSSFQHILLVLYCSESIVFIQDLLSFSILNLLLHFA